MIKNCKGAVTAVMLLALGLFAAGSWAWYKVVEPDRNKKIATKAAQAAALTEIQARAAKEQADAVAAATLRAQDEHAKERAVRDQVDRNTSGFVEGAKIALQADPNPSQAEIVAIGLLDSASQALGQPLTNEQRAVWIKTVAGLIAKNADAEERTRQLTQQAAETRAALNEVKIQADMANNNAVAMAKQLDEQTKELTKNAGKSAELTAENKAWANNEQTLWGRLKALGLVAGILGLALILLSLKFRGVSNTLKDAVALGEHLKTTAVKAGAGAIELEHEVATWWGNDISAQKKFHKVKEKLRL